MRVTGTTSLPHPHVSRVSPRLKISAVAPHTHQIFSILGLLLGSRTARSSLWSRPYGNSSQKAYNPPLWLRPPFAPFDPTRAPGQGEGLNEEEQTTKVHHFGRASPVEINIPLPGLTTPLLMVNPILSPMRATKSRWTSHIYTRIKC